MKYIITVTTFLFIAINLLSYGQVNNKVIFYVGTFSGNGSEGLYICSFDEKKGDVELKSVYKGLDSPNYAVKSLSGEFLYVCLRPQQADINGYGAIASFKINQEDGSLSFLNEQSSQGADPCYAGISKDEKYLAVANYGGGNISRFNIKPDGSLSSAVQVIQHEGNGPVEGNQNGPHAHSVRFSPFSNQVFAADLGIDKLMVYDSDILTGILTAGEVPYVNIKPGSGPRHFEFHPKGRYIYVINEINSTVSVVDLENDYNVIQVISTLPDNYEGKSYCADIHINSNGKYLYCSNRGHNSIATFKVGKNGLLKRVNTVSTHGDWPRNFTLSPDEKYMLVANQNSNNITVYKISHENGIPVFINKEIKIPNPVCLVF
jgi:6-phosphogluconolactonase